MGRLPSSLATLRIGPCLGFAGQPPPRLRDDDVDDEDDAIGKKEGAPRKRRRPAEPKSMTDQQRVERRERNREHAKRSRIRKKFLLESLLEQVSRPSLRWGSFHSLHSPLRVGGRASQVSDLRDENKCLRQVIRDHLADEAHDVLHRVTPGDSTIHSHLSV